MVWKASKKKNPGQVAAASSSAAVVSAAPDKKTVVGGDDGLISSKRSVLSVPEADEEYTVRVTSSSFVLRTLQLGG